MQIKYPILLALALFVNILWWWMPASDKTPPFTMTLESETYTYKTDQVFLHYFYEEQEQVVEKIRHLFPDLIKISKPSKIKLLHLHFAAPLSEQDFWQRLRSVNALPNVMITPYFSDGAGGFFSYSDEILIILKEGQTPNGLREVLAAHNMNIVKSQAEDERFVLVKFPKTELKRIDYYLDVLSLHPAVFTTQPNYLLTAYTQQSDPKFDKQWYLDYNEFQYESDTSCIDSSTFTVTAQQNQHVNAVDAWNIDAASNPNDNRISGKANGIPIKIAIIDDGVDSTHEDLMGNMLLGYDAIFNTFGVNGQYDGQDLYGGNGTSDNSHGTGCIGIAAAVGDNNKGIKGVAYGAQIISIRGGTLFTNDSVYTLSCINMEGDTIGTTIKDAFLLTAMSNYLAFEKAFTFGADVSTNSWNFSIIVPESDALDYVVNSMYYQGRDGKGTPIFFAAGNDNLSTGVGYPASLEPVIAVGAASLDGHRKSALSSNAAGDNCYMCGLTVFDYNDNINGGIPYDKEMWWGSNHGVGLDIVAPGVRMQTTAPGNGTYSDSFNGTSSACPLAAGIMALILDANPNLSATQARYILEATATKVYENTDYFYTSDLNQPNGSWNNQVGYGRVDAYAAVKEANDATCLELSFNDTNGSFGDGSISSIDPTVDYNYNNHQTCTWQIQPPDATSITLEFTQFDLAPGDLLKVYEGLDETGTLVTFSAFNPPTTETFNSSALFIQFLSDGNPNGGLGWSLEYSSEENTTGDNCNDPIVIQCGQILTSSTNNGGENIDNYNCSTYSQTGPEQIFELNLDAAASLEIELSILGSSDLDLFLLNSCDPSACVDFSTGTSDESITASLNAGAYYIVVDGYNGAVDDFMLSVNCDDGSPETLLCNEAININCGASVSGSTANSFNQSSDYDCWNGLAGGEAIYRFQLPESKPVEIAFGLSQNNMRMLLLDACDPDACIAQSNDEISFNQLSAGEYFLIIDAPTGDNGDFQFIISCGVGAPDLTYGEVHTINQQGTTLSGSASVYNASCNGTAGASITHFYLSIDTRYDNGNDILVHSEPTPALAPDATHTFDYNFTVGNITPGWYYLFYRVDATNVVSEAFGNTNNYVWRALDERVTIQSGSNPNVTLVHGLSDLEVTGDELTHYMKIVNTESVAASAFTIGYYLSDNLSISTFDHLLGEVNISGLGPNETMDLNFSEEVSDVLPDLEPGFYTFGFIIDSGDDLQQSNENDDVWRWTGAEQQIAINESSYCDQITVLTDNSGSFGDGSGDEDYVSNTYCQWLINPTETASSITLTFESFNTEFAWDFVHVYSGNSLLNTELAELDGNVGTTTVTANSSQMYIRFSSDNSNNYPGWTASYTSVPRRYCDGLTELFAESGQINDGSLCLPYQDNLNCTWLIDPGVPNTQILLDFEEFALVPGQDYLHVYDGDSDTAPLLASLTGDILPDDLPIPSGQAFLKFETDATDVDEGFTINYQTVSSSSYHIAGQIHREDGVPIPLTSVACSNQNDQIVDNSGDFDFEVPGGVDYLVRPSRNFDWKEGVNIADYIFIQYHVLGLFPLNSPYQIIAADVNRSGSVSTVDAALVYQLMLNNITEFPNNESWRFIAADHVFSNPNNPWADNFPEQKEYNNIDQDWIAQDFIAVKIGDVNGEADGVTLASESDDRSVLTLQADSRSIAAGETFTVQLRLDEPTDIQALQARLKLDPLQVELVQLTSSVLPDFKSDNIGKLDSESGVMNLIWVPSGATTNCISLKNKEILFSLEVKAKVDIANCKNTIAFAKTEDFHSFVLDQYLQKHDLQINWTHRNDGLQLVANPNPFLAETQVRYVLPKTGFAKLRIMNLNGQTIRQFELPADQQSGTLIIEQSVFPVSGTYLLELILEDQSKTIQIIHL